LVQAILLARMVYLQLAANFGSRLALATIPDTYFFAVPILVAIVAAVVQIFYAYRVKLLTNRYIVPGVIVFLSLLQLAGGITLGVIVKETVLFCELMHKKEFIAAGVWNGASALCDVIIAVYMTYLLSRQKSIWKQTQRTIHKLIRLILETGMLTAAIAITNFCLFLIPSTAYYQTTSLVLGKMYSNSMMVVLNSRIDFRITNDTMVSEPGSPITTSADPVICFEVA